MFAVVVTLALRPGAREAFLALAAANAAKSRASEPGCRRFDVCADPDRPGTALLYELYDTPEAFAAHLDTAHFRAFDRDAAALVADKDVRTFREVRS